MNATYFIERYESRNWLMQLRYHWRIRHKNGSIVLHSGQGHSRRVDRDDASLNFYNACVPGVVAFPDEA
jgi:hypothetical protein